MVNYECDVCKKVFDHKGNYNNHKAKKNPCKVSVISDRELLLLALKKIDDMALKIKYNAKSNCNI
jgi:hypothetical protein